MSALGRSSHRVKVVAQPSIGARNRWLHPRPRKAPLRQANRPVVLSLPVSPTRTKFHRQTLDAHAPDPDAGLYFWECHLRPTVRARSSARRHVPLQARKASWSVRFRGLHEQENIITQDCPDYETRSSRQVDSSVRVPSCRCGETTTSGQTPTWLHFSSTAPEPRTFCTGASCARHARWMCVGLKVESGEPLLITEPG